MRFNPWIAVVAAVVFALVVGAMAYNFGVAQGISQSGKIVAAPGAPAAPYPYPYPYYGYGWHGGPFFFGPFLFILICLSFVRMLFWAGRGGWRHGRYGYRDLDEWHRQAHQQGTAPQQ